MQVDTPRLMAASIAYGAGVLLVAQAGTAALDTLATALDSAGNAVGGALSAGIAAVLTPASDIELLTAVLAPLAFVAMVAILGLMVWPAIVDHVPNSDPAPQTDTDAEVLALPTRHSGAEPPETDRDPAPRR